VEVGGAMQKLNIYKVKGKYSLWNDNSLPTEVFSRSVLANNVNEAIDIIKDQYSEAVVESITLFEGDILVGQTHE
jgi:hypothetical protein